MAGFENTIVFSAGEKLSPSSNDDIIRMQELSTDISRINHTGDPEGVVSANPSSLSHDPVSGNIYFKQTGTGNTGWVLLGSSIPFQPNKIIQDFDDFLSSQNHTTGKLNWINNVWNNEGSGSATNPGILIASTSTGLASQLLLTYYPSNITSPIILGGGSLNINWVFDLVGLSTALDHYTMYIGLGDAFTLRTLDGTEVIDGAYFKYSNDLNGGKWQINTASAGVRTTNDSLVLATTGFHNYGIQVNAAATSISFTIDGVAIATSPINTNIPTANITPFLCFFPDVGNPAGVQVDLFYYTQILTTAR